MKQNIKWIVMLTLMLVASVCLPSLVQAQPFPNCPDPNVACPIDGGLSFLIAAGVGYGIKKVRDSRKQQQGEKNL